MSAADDVLDAVLAEYAEYETDGESGWVDMRRMVAEIVRLRAIEAALAADAPPEAFVQYVERNLPPNTIISNPAWWAKRLWCAAVDAARRGPHG